MITTSNEPTSQRATNRPLLRRRTLRLFAGWAQLFAAGLFMLQPLHQARAIYVPDANGQPVWVPLAGEPLVPTSGPDTTLDATDTPVWLTDFGVAAAQEVVRYWPGGTFPVSGIWTSYAVEWYAATTVAGEPDDADADGIPDALDPFPQDASNESFEWEGGTFQFHGIRHAFRADLYAGSPTDANSDGLPDCLMSWFTNPSAHGTLQHWPGGTGEQIPLQHQPVEETSCLSFYGYRYYAPQLGRWLSKDPIGERGGVNLSGFVSNNSVSMVDVLGLSWSDFFGSGMVETFITWLGEECSDLEYGCRLCCGTLGVVHLGIGVDEVIAGAAAISASPAVGPGAIGGVVGGAALIGDGIVTIADSFVTTGECDNRCQDCDQAPLG